MIDDVLPQGALKCALDTICSKNHGSIALASEAILAKGRVHEVLGDSAELLAFATLKCVSGQVFWIGLGRDLATISPAGLQDFIDPSRVVLTEGVTRNEVLWAGEQALRTPGIAGVVIDVERGLDLKESRRLQLAAEESGAIGIILVRGRAQTSAAETRWRCESIRSQNFGWRWVCQKHRRGETGQWQVRWLGDDNGQGVIHMASATAA